MKHPIIVAAVNNNHIVVTAFLCNHSLELSMQFANCLTAPTEFEVEYLIIARAPQIFLGGSVPRDILIGFCQKAADLWGNDYEEIPFVTADDTVFYRIDM